MDRRALTHAIVSGRKGIAIRSDGARPGFLGAAVRAQAQRLAEINSKPEAAANRQVSVTDPDALSRATSGRGTGIVGYNVRTAVGTKRHLIVEHPLTNVRHCRTQLKAMARRRRDVMDGASLMVLADRGYFSR